MWAWLMRFTARASWKKRWMRWVFRACSARSTLIAAGRPRLTWRAWKTRPIAPSPSIRSSRYWPSTSPTFSRSDSSTRSSGGSCSAVLGGQQLGARLGLEDRPGHRLGRGESPRLPPGGRHPSTTGVIQPAPGSPTSSISRPRARMSARGSGSPVPSASPGPMSLGVKRERPPTRNTCSGGSAPTTTPAGAELGEDRAEGQHQQRQLVGGELPGAADVGRQVLAVQVLAHHEGATVGKAAGLDLPGQVGVLQPAEDLGSGPEGALRRPRSPSGSRGRREPAPAHRSPAARARHAVPAGLSSSLVSSWYPKSVVIPRPAPPTRLGRFPAPGPTPNGRWASRRARWPTLCLLSHIAGLLP